MGRLTFLYQSNLPHRAIAVYMHLYDRANKSLQCWPAIPTIAYDLGLSASTIKRALNDLTRAGFISKKNRYRRNGGNSSTLYTLMQPKNY